MDARYDLQIPKRFRNSHARSESTPRLGILAREPCEGIDSLPDLELVSGSEGTHYVRADRDQHLFNTR